MRRGEWPRVAVSWQRDRRCGWCGRSVPVGAEAGYGWGRGYCEPCFVARERRQAAVWALRLARSTVVSGAA